MLYFTFCTFISFQLISRRLLITSTLLQASIEYTRQALELSASVMRILQRSMDLLSIYGIPVSSFKLRPKTLYNLPHTDLMHHIINIAFDTPYSHTTHGTDTLHLIYWPRPSYTAIIHHSRRSYTTHNIHILYSIPYSALHSITDAFATLFFSGPIPVTSHSGCPSGTFSASLSSRGSGTRDSSIQPEQSWACSHRE